MKRWSVAVLALSLALPLSASAEVPDFNPNAFSLYGAETLGMGGLGVAIGYGVPNVQLQVGVGVFDMEGIAGFIAPALDLTAQLKTSYLLTTEVGGRLRFRLIKIKKEGARHALALWGEFGYILENTISPKDDQTGEYQEYDEDTMVLTSRRFAYKDKKSFAWPYDYRDTYRAAFGALYSMRGGGTTYYFEVGGERWFPSDRTVLGAFVPADGLGGEAWQPGYYLEREPFWLTRISAGVEFNLSINVNFFLSASVAFGKDPNLGKSPLTQKVSNGNPAYKVIGSEWDPYAGEEVELKIPVVESPSDATRVTGQFMAGILLFWNEF